MWSASDKSIGTIQVATELNKLNDCGQQVNKGNDNIENYLKLFLSIVESGAIRELTFSDGVKYQIYADLLES